MTSIGVWHVSVDVLIADRRRRNHAIVLPWRRNGFFIVTARRILALGNGFSPVPCACAGETAKLEPLQTMGKTSVKTSTHSRGT